MCRTPEHIQAAHNEAAKFGAAFHWEVSNGNHIMCLITLNGNSRKIFLSKTPSDCACNHDAKRYTRQAIRALGGM